MSGRRSGQLQTRSPRLARLLRVWHLHTRDLAAASVGASVAKVSRYESTRCRPASGLWDGSSRRRRDGRTLAGVSSKPSLGQGGQLGRRGRPPRQGMVSGGPRTTPCGIGDAPKGFQIRRRLEGPPIRPRCRCICACDRRLPTHTRRRAPQRQCLGRVAHAHLRSHERRVSIITRLAGFVRASRPPRSASDAVPPHWAGLVQAPEPGLRRGPTRRWPPWRSQGGRERRRRSWTPCPSLPTRTRTVMCPLRPAGCTPRRRRVRSTRATGMPSPG